MYYNGACYFGYIFLEGDEVRSKVTEKKKQMDKEKKQMEEKDMEKKNMEKKEMEKNEKEKDKDTSVIRQMYPCL